MALNGEPMTPPKPDDDFWIFGYGSLIWKPPPHYDRRVPGWVTGYVRRFWQASQDHRGTPTAPGRVVTLIERPFWATLADAHASAPARVWGAAYRIRRDRVAEVKAYLDIREINGYTIHWEAFHPSSSSSSPFPPSSSSPSSPSPSPDPDPSSSSTTTTTTNATTPIRALVYIGTPANDQFTGPQDPQALAEHIYVSEGPSGPNREYLLELERALAALGSGPDESGDAHVSDLCDRVRELERRRAAGVLDVDALRAEVRARDAAARGVKGVVVDGDDQVGVRRSAEEGKEGEGEGEVPHEFARVTSVEEQEETEKR
ncbi:ChaC-domain-containing protein [Biscogniauxia mediterranea]|nr:ChaC-domain-containing protein [Biscogniauxia mediterranea]